VCCALSDLCDTVPLPTSTGWLALAGDQRDTLLRAACILRQVELAKMILDDPRPGLFTHDSDRIIESILKDATTFGHMDIARLVLQHPCVAAAPRLEHALSEAIIHAVWKNSVDAVVLFLVDPRIDPTKNGALGHACAWGHDKLARLLLADPRIDPAAHNNKGLTLACHHGRVDIVRMLLVDRRVDPALPDQEAVIRASASGQDSVLRLLMAGSHRMTRCGLRD
jgi:hypothetical protein